MYPTDTYIFKLSTLFSKIFFLLAFNSGIRSEKNGKVQLFNLEIGIQIKIFLFERWTKLLGMGGSAPVSLNL